MLRHEKRIFWRIYGDLIVPLTTDADTLRYSPIDRARYNKLFASVSSWLSAPGAVCSRGDITKTKLEVNSLIVAINSLENQLTG